MPYLLDTNILSELRKGERCAPVVATWAKAQDPRDLFTSVLVIGEIRKGIERRRRTDATQATALERWLASVLSAFHGRILPIDVDVAEDWGRLNAPQTLPPIDSLLAATARIHSLILVTRDAALSADAGLTILNPFEAR